ncbi:MAG TPA: TolC family protein [Chitinophagaceae bacterium]|nr:TolC family protein [Chitinophagaceae bacterium]
MHKLFLLLLIIVLSEKNFSQSAPDTIPVTLPEAETKAIQNNLLLVASQYNIEAGRAQIIQAKLWDNPVLNTDQNIYDGKFFRHTTVNGQPYGQVFIQLLQEFKTAGKRTKLAALATTSAQLAELQFADVLRNLKYAVRTNLYTAWQLKQTKMLYQQESHEIETLLAGMKAQYDAGNISLKDLLRVQALGLSLKQSLAETDKQWTDVNSALRLLLQEDKDIVYDPQLPEPVTTLPVLADTLLQQAKKNNPEYLSEQNQLLFQQRNLVYQKSLRAPDITAGVEYDHASSYAPNYWGLAVSLPLPLFNRNQGNIKAAQFSIKQEESLVQQKDRKLQNELQTAISKLQLNYKVLNAGDKNYYAQYQQLLNNAVESYRQRQMGLLEFVDLFEAFRDTRLQYLQQQLNYRKAKEDLNFTIGTDVIK